MPKEHAEEATQSKLIFLDVNPSLPVSTQLRRTIRSHVTRQQHEKRRKSTRNAGDVQSAHSSATRSARDTPALALDDDTSLDEKRS